MIELNIDDIRRDLAEKNGLKKAEKSVCCFNCKHWGYNCGKVLNSQCESKCQLRKENTCSSNWCKKFEVEE